MGFTLPPLNLDFASTANSGIGPIQFGSLTVNYGNGNTNSDSQDATSSQSPIMPATKGIPIASGFAPGYDAAAGGPVMPSAAGTNQTAVFIAVGAVLLVALLRHRKG